MWILKGEVLVFFFGFFFVGGGVFFRFVGLGAIGGIVDILRDGWDSWGEWERRVGESGSRRVVREGRVGWRGGEGKKKKGRGKDDGDGER